MTNKDKQTSRRTSFLRSAVHFLALSLVFWMTNIFSVHGQQRPHYSQYVLNNFVLNPALSGIENYTDVKLSHRHQWAGFEGAPVTTYFTIHGALGKKDYRTTPTSFDIPGENPRGKAYWESYTAPEPHHGLGLQVVNDRTGPLNRFNLQATYAYHIGLNATTSLSAGVGAGFSNNTLNRSKLNFFNPVIDPAVFGSGNLNSLRPDLSVGLWLYSAKAYVGVSVQQILPQRVQYSEQANALAVEEGRLVPHSFITAGYRFFVSDDVSVLPSVMLKYIQPTPMQGDLNVKFQYRDLLWVGAGARTNGAFIGMMGLNISNTFNIGYSYDYTQSNLQQFSRGSHEIMIGFLLGNRWGDLCPRNVW